MQRWEHGDRQFSQVILLGNPSRSYLFPIIWPLTSLGPGTTCPHGGKWEVQFSLPRDRVCNLTGRHWKNWAGFSAFGCLFPSGKAAFGQHEPLSGHLVTLSRELICPKNDYGSPQSLLVWGDHVYAITSSIRKDWPRVVSKGVCSEGCRAPWVQDCIKSPYSWT